MKKLLKENEKSMEDLVNENKSNEEKLARENKERQQKLAQENKQRVLEALMKSESDNDTLKNKESDEIDPSLLSKTLPRAPDCPVSSLHAIFTLGLFSISRIFQSKIRVNINLCSAN